MSADASAVASRYLPAALSAALASGLFAIPFRQPGEAASEDEDVAGHRVVFQRRLHLCGQTIEEVAHVIDTGNQPDFGPRG